jgi:voltage-gated potassium channel
MYFSATRTGTTVGYGDRTPSSDLGKVLVSLYCIMAIPVFGLLLEPVKEYLVHLCHVKETHLPLKVD